ECAQLGLGQDVGRQYEYRQVGGGRRDVTDLLQQLEAVQPRHVEVEQHDVGLPRLEQFEDALWVRRAENLQVAGTAQNALEQAKVHLLVVDRQNPACRDVDLAHVLTPARAP